MKKETGSVVSKEIFRDQVVDVGLNLGFYYIDNDTFYGIHSECYPIECKILPKNREEKYIGWQCNGDTHRDGEVIASFDDEHDIWDNSHPLAIAYYKFRLSACFLSIRHAFSNTSLIFNDLQQK